MIKAEELEFTYPLASRAAVSGLSFQAEPGETIAVIGGGCSGKSTLLYLLAGLAPTLIKGQRRGRLLVAGSDPAAAPLEARLRAAGIVFSEPSNQITGICPSVEEEIAWSLGNLGTDPDIMHRRVETAVKKLGLEDIRLKAPWQLSSGQQQMTAIAAALVLEPQVLLFDEPTAHLDAASRHLVADIARETAASGRTVIWAASSLEDIAGFSRWIYLQQGRIMYDGPPFWMDADALPAPWTRLAQAAQKARNWPGALPLTEPEAVQGFAALRTHHGRNQDR